MANTPGASELVSALNRLAYVSFMKDCKLLGCPPKRKNIPSKVSPQSISHSLRKLLKSLLGEEASISKFRSAFSWHVEVSKLEEYSNPDFREFLYEDKLMKKHFHIVKPNFDDLFRCVLVPFNTERHGGLRYLLYNQSFLSNLRTYLDKITTVRDILPKLYTEFVEKDSRFRKDLQARYLAIAAKKQLGAARSAS